MGVHAGNQTICGVHRQAEFIRTAHAYVYILYIYYIDVCIIIC